MLVSPAMRSFSTTDDSNTKKRREVVYIDKPGNYKGYDFSTFDKGFAIDVDDYNVISELLSTAELRGDEIERYARNLVEIRENDDERRVYRVHLRSLRGSVVDIMSRPVSIGRFKDLTNLTHLNLDTMDSDKRITLLPDSIGKLTNLTILSLFSSAITSLPPSIGRIQNLQNLNLGYTDKLLQLPEEIGDLASLRTLDLSCSGITSLPPSIGRLQNLKDLDLSHIKKLLQLPEEIGGLASLEYLNLGCSGIASLPPSIGRLQTLKDLDLSWTVNLSELPEEIGDLASLRTLDLDSDWREGVRGETKIFFAMACHGARARIIRTKPKLWPLILNNATRAFDKFDVSYPDGHGKIFRVEKNDAIYQFLVDGTDSFVRLICDRNRITKDV